MGSLLAAFLAQVVIVTYRDYATGRINQLPVPLPLPADYTAPIVVYGALALVPGEGAGRIAGMVGWGLVVATVLNLWDPATGKPRGKKMAATKPTKPGETQSQVPGGIGPPVPSTPGRF